MAGQDCGAKRAHLRRIAGMDRLLHLRSGGGEVGIPQVIGDDIVQLAAHLFDGLFLAALQGQLFGEQIYHRSRGDPQGAVFARRQDFLRQGL